MAVYQIGNYAPYTQPPVHQGYVTPMILPGEYAPNMTCHLSPPALPCPPPSDMMMVAPPPPLTVLHTKDIPLTPIKTADFNSEKKIGKLLSCYTKNMEMVWHGEFNRLCQNFLPHHWYLSPAFDMPMGNEWVTFKDSAKVRFLCKFCAHGWTSMKGRVVFWFMLDEKTFTGIVIFKLFGQRCQNCSPSHFEHAMWYPEEVIKVIGNLFNRIGQEYYGFYSPPVRVDRRLGRPQAKHNASMCQACAEGLCPRYRMQNELEDMESSLSAGFQLLEIEG